MSLPTPRPPQPLTPFSVRFWGWSENAREEALDLAELRQRVQDGKSLYGESDQPEHVQAAAYRNSAFSQLKFRESLCASSVRFADSVARFRRGVPHVSLTTTKSSEY